MLHVQSTELISDIQSEQFLLNTYVFKNCSNQLFQLLVHILTKYSTHDFISQILSTEYTRKSDGLLFILHITLPLPNWSITH